ncbi:MAG: hypothetical protein AB4352_12820 [Hormoscilla sp.]
MIQKTRRRVPRGMPLLSDRPRCSQEEIEKRNAAVESVRRMNVRRSPLVPSSR